jgi:hypothetical protein
MRKKQKETSNPRGGGRAEAHLTSRHRPLPLLRHHEIEVAIRSAFISRILTNKSGLNNESLSVLNYAYPEIHPNVRTSRLRADLVRPVPLYKNSALAKNVKKVVLQINPVDASFRNFVPTKTGVKATQESKLQDRISVSRVQKFSHVVFTDPIFTTDPRSFRHHETRQNAFRQVLLRDQILNETPTGILGFTFFF